MSRIRPLGRFWPLDEEGFLANDAAHWKIASPFSSVVEEARVACLEAPGIRSFYVRGTVARGEAIQEISDLDCLAVLERSPTTVELSRMENRAEEIGYRNSCVSGVTLELVDLAEIGFSSGPLRFSELGLQLVTQGLCLAGRDDTSALPRYRPGVLVANNDVCQIRSDIQEALRAVEQDRSPKNVEYWCRRISKNVVRTGLSLTLPDGGRYARDLYPCYRAFSEMYPEAEANMKLAVASILSLTTDAGQVKDFLTGFGSWIACTADAWLARHNPSGELGIALSDFPEEVSIPDNPSPRTT